MGGDYFSRHARVGLHEAAERYDFVSRTGETCTNAVNLMSGPNNM